MLLQKNKLSLIVSAFGALSAPYALSQSDEPTIQEEVVVTGFRQAVAAALDVKRDAVNAKESIVAEDMGKMVDLNLAEAIQRVPGVAITREGGEGRQISLRGLGADFTHVTLNGMEVPASAGGLDSSGGINRGRAFDFNVFSAELFNRIDVTKSPEASIEEGGIAGSVELYTLRPLDAPGRKLSVTGKLGYNDLSEEVDPRLSFVYSDNNANETFGWMVSASYTERTTQQDGFGTVRWHSPDADGSSFADENVDNMNLEQLNALWYPRLPRQDSFGHDQERLGFSGALQFRPTDKLEFGVNYVASRFDATVNAYNSFAQFRRNGGWGWPVITVEDVTVARQGNTDYAIAGTFTGVGLRTESRRQADTTDFDQFTADMEWNISDNLVLTGMVGTAVSDFTQNYFRANIETLIDVPEQGDRTGTRFSYDFTRDPDVATLQYSNFDTTDPNNFYIMNNERIRSYNIKRSNDTGRVDLDWTLDDQNSFQFGLIVNNREVDSVESRQDLDVPTDVASISRVFSYDDTGGFGSDTTLDFLVLDFDKAIPAFGSQQEVARGVGIETWNVQEETTGLYAQYNLNTEIAGYGLRLNAGVREVSTDVTALGWLGQETPNEETNSFTNTLPSLNVAFDLTDDMLIRFGLAKTLTRPGMQSLAPAKSYGDVNNTISGGNSQLEPLLSDDLNLAWEYYFAEEAFIGLAYFRKDIESFISRPTTEEPLRAEDRPVVTRLFPEQPELLDDIWTYSSATNTEGSELDGFEISYQQTFSQLPGFLSNVGILANYSYVDGTTIIERSGIQDEAPLEGLSKNSYNATLFYEVDAWGARLSVNNRDDYVTRNIGGNGNFSENTTGPTQFDFSGTYNVNDYITLTLQVVNLFDEFERLYVTGPEGDMNLVREYNHTGRQIFFGIRGNF